jgi:acyl-CoA synthetase (NDP forming)
MSIDREPEEMLCDSQELATDGGTEAALDRLLRPKSVAVIGASDKPGSLGASVLSNLERNRFSGAIYPVNPKRERIGTLPCLPSVEALPDGLDVAVLAIPRAAVVETIHALAERKVGAAVIFSAGFAEGGETGASEQREIAHIAAETGMVVEGPNCLGCVNYVDGVPLTFVHTEACAPSGPTGIGIVSQSGAMAAVLSTMLGNRALDLTFFISTGNEAASGVEDYVDYLVEDPVTTVIAMIVEQFRKPRRFLAAARRAQAAGKTIVLLHPGRSSAARQSAATHTGAMAGDYQLMRVKVQRAGVVFAETLEELGDIAEIALRGPAVGPAGAAVLGESGAFKALTFDLCESLGLDLPRIGDHDSPALRGALPEFVGVTNPLDLTAQGLVDPDLYVRTLAALFDDDRFGSILVGLIQTDRITSEIKFPPVLQAIRDHRPTKPVIVAGLDEGAAVPAAYIDELRSLGSVYFSSTERALRALGRLTAHARRERRSTAVGGQAVTGLGGYSGVVPEYAAKQLLAPFIPFPTGRFAATVEEAVAAAQAIGGRVVMKAQAAALSHKSDAGGVTLNLEGADAVRSAWARMHADVARYDPAIHLDGVLIEAMGRPGIELIVGARNDPDWGPVLLVGFGGVTAEVLKDVRLIAPDLPEQAIVAELRRLKSAKLFDGFRGAPKADLEAAAQLIASLGRIMLAEPRIGEIDLNPVIVLETGVVALDALMILRD